MSFTAHSMDTNLQVIDKGLGDVHMGFRKLLTQLPDPQVVFTTPVPLPGVSD